MTHALPLGLVWAGLVGWSVLTLAGLAGLILTRRWGRRPGGRAARGRALLAAACLVCLLAGAVLLTGELALVIAAPSDGFRFTLAGQRWYERYWTPVNRYGYRDVEHDIPARDAPGRPHVVAVVGDSFAAGVGVDDVENRFSERLAARLGAGWVVANVAGSGWNTEDALAAVRSWPHEPDLVILQWFVNDIEGAARRVGLQPPQLASRPTGLLGSVVNRSYILDALWWRWVRARGWRGMVDAARDHLARTFASPEAWQLHTADLAAVHEYAHAHGGRLVLVAFPDLGDVGGTAPHTARIAAWCSARGVPVLDLAPILLGRAADALVVSAMDTHPNEALHAEVADLLEPLVRAAWP